MNRRLILKGDQLKAYGGYGFRTYAKVRINFDGWKGDRVHINLDPECDMPYVGWWMYPHQVEVIKDAEITCIEK